MVRNTCSLTLGSSDGMLMLLKIFLKQMLGCAATIFGVVDTLDTSASYSFLLVSSLMAAGLLARILFISFMMSDMKGCCFSALGPRYSWLVAWSWKLAQYRMAICSWFLSGLFGSFNTVDASSDSAFSLTATSPSPPFRHGVYASSALILSILPVHRNRLHACWHCLAFLLVIGRIFAVWASFAMMCWLMKEARWCIVNFRSRAIVMRRLVVFL